MQNITSNGIVCAGYDDWQEGVPDESCCFLSGEINSIA